MSNIFISNQHVKSARFAVIEDDGVASWLYLTNPNDNQPVADCWLYNRIKAPKQDEIRNYKNGAPPCGGRVYHYYGIN